MTRLEALRRHVVAHAATCKRLDRWFRADESLAEALNDADSLESHLMVAARLSRAEVKALIAPLLTKGAKNPPPATESLIMDVRTVAKLG